MIAGRRTGVAKPLKADIVLAKQPMPLSDRRLPSATDEVSAEPKRPAARGKGGELLNPGPAPEARSAKSVKAPKEVSASGEARTPKAAKAPKAADKPAPALAKTADKLAKLGLTSDINLVLHLPMRYEDETSLTPISHLLPGGMAQTEGVVFDNEIAYRPRRQLLVKLRDDAGDELVLRFLNFYGSQVKQMAIGARLRVRGDVRGGFFGMEMVHPAVRVVDEDTPLPQALTPVYPSTAGVSQAYLRKAIDNALSRNARLLQGDVGAGKTVVAALAAAVAMDAGWHAR
jgi:ATP-dependent DNA helicase RecG